jgi:hypothetical protein
MIIFQFGLKIFFLYFIYLWVYLYYLLLNQAETMKSTQLKHYDHIICGGGLVGALWALFLRKRSQSIAIFESYWDLRQQTIS